MRKTILSLLTLAGILASSAALADCGPNNPNCVVPTAPFGTIDDRAASTAFVNAAIVAVGGGVIDESAFSAGVSTFGPFGGFYQTTPTANPLTDGQQGMAQLTAQRAVFANLRNASGTEVGTVAVPLQVSVANTGANATAVLVNQPTAANFNATVVGTGTFATQSAITAASGSIASGAVASGAFASGSFASGAFASGSVASGAFASGSIADGAEVTLGAKADAKSTATDTTAVTVMQVLKEMSFMLQTPAALPANQSANVAQINGATPLMGNGLTGTGAIRVSIASDSTGVVQPGNTANTTPWLMQEVPGTTGGVSTYVLEPTASDNHANIKNGAGQVYWITAFNNSATINYMRLYNAATGFNGCNSATNLLWEGHVPANTSDAGFVINLGPGAAFSTGISICVTGAYGQTSTTSATASAMSVVVGYK